MAQVRFVVVLQSGKSTLCLSLIIPRLATTASYRFVAKDAITAAAFGDTTTVVVKVPKTVFAPFIVVVRRTVKLFAKPPGTALLKLQDPTKLPGKIVITGCEPVVAS